MYEEAIQTVVTVRDFTQVFDAYAQFEESIISAKMEQTVESGATEEGNSKWLITFMTCLNGSIFLVQWVEYCMVNLRIQVWTPVLPDFVGCFFGESTRSYLCPVWPSPGSTLILMG